MATIETVRSTIALMIDCETLALSPDAYITQVGICIADTATRTILMPAKNYWMSPANQKDRRIDFETVRFWMKQHPDVISGVFNAPKIGDREERISPVELWHILEVHVKAYPGLTVWASPAMSDLMWLKTLWGERGIPWKYSQERDMMTLYKELDRDGSLQPPANEKAHDGAADAAWQMEYLFNLLDLIRGQPSQGATS